MLRLPDHWVWDSWLAVDGPDYHLFFLRASRALLDPARRHFRASVGHAVSTDLCEWTLLPDALVSSDGTAWDNQAIWTGSTVRGPDGRWYLFYTGVGRERHGFVQRIGVAVSDDMLSWQRPVGRPLLQPDPRWYQVADPQRGVDPGWRDPYVYPDPNGDGWHMLICATARPERRGGRTAGRGVIGHARSHDLIDWELTPPVSAPAGFGEIELPQIHVVDGQPLLIFSCGEVHQPPERRDTGDTSRIFSVAGDSVTGHWDLAAAEPFPHPTLYAAQLIRRPDGQWCLFGFRDIEDGVFQGEILDPIPVDRVGGRLVPADVSVARC